MNRDDAKHFVLAIAAMAATFRVEATEALYTGYEMGLDDLPIENIKCAVRRAIRECRFMPSASELRELAGDLVPQHRAVLAWDEAMKAMAKHGPYVSVDFDDKTINATIRSMGGWPRFDELLEIDQEKWVRKEFERIYVAKCRAGVFGDAALPLIGIHDQSNTANGYFDAVKPATRICSDPVRRDVKALPLEQLQIDSITDNAKP